MLLTKGWTVRIVLLGALACAGWFTGCGQLRTTAQPGFAKPDWIMKETRRLLADELWKEHNGGDQIYISRGCLSETMSDYRHRSEPWMIRSSVFDHATPDGARSLLDYYRRGIENEINLAVPIGQACYLWKLSLMKSWTIGFWKGKSFVEVSLTEETGPDIPMSEKACHALLDFAQRLAVTLR